MLTNAGAGVRFSEVRWFGDTVTWLAPDAPTPFRHLTRLVTVRFPEWPPYGGEHDGMTPHLTIGHDHPRPALESAASAIRPLLPITAEVHRAELWQSDTNPPTHWHHRTSYPLA